MTHSTCFVALAVFTVGITIMLAVTYLLAWLMREADNDQK